MTVQTIVLTFPWLHRAVQSKGSHLIVQLVSKHLQWSESQNLKKTRGGGVESVITALFQNVTSASTACKLRLLSLLPKVWLYVLL